MKTDREFLDGIYQKAAVLEESKELSADIPQNNIAVAANKRIFSMNSFRAIAIAAAFIIIAAPSAYFLSAGENKMEIPEGYSLVERNVNEFNHGKSVSGVPQTGSLTAQNVARLPMSIALDDGPIEQAELVCAAKVIKIEKSVYDKENSHFTTTVVIKPTDIYKDVTANNAAEGEKLRLKVDGGFDKKSKSYQEYETVFEKGEEILLLAIPTYEDTDTYILSEGSESKYLQSGENEQGDVVYKNSVDDEILQSTLLEYAKLDDLEE